MKVAYSQQKSKDQVEVKVKSGDRLSVSYQIGGKSLEITGLVLSANSTRIVMQYRNEAVIIEPSNSSVEMIGANRSFGTLEEMHVGDKAVRYPSNRVPYYMKEVQGYVDRPVEIGTEFTLYKNRYRRDVKFVVTHISTFGQFVIESVEPMGYETFCPVILVSPTDRDLIRSLGVKFK